MTVILRLRRSALLSACKNLMNSTEIITILGLTAMRQKITISLTIGTWPEKKCFLSLRKKKRKSLIR